MIVLDRRAAARFRAAVRRCVAGRPRGLAPPIHLQQTPDSLTFSAILDEVAIAWRLPTHAASAVCLAVPWATLTALEGPGGGIATLEEAEAGRLCCRWSERGENKVVECPSVPQQPTRAACPVPPTMAAVDPALLAALHACGQTAGRVDNGRDAERGRSPRESIVGAAAAIPEAATCFAIRLDQLATTPPRSQRETMTPTPTLTDHLTELADTLDDLRRRFRQAAREEVARAVGEALRQVALSMIGSSPRPLPRRPEYDSWLDRWQDDPAADSWDAGISRRDDLSARERRVTESSPLHPAVIAGLWAARWGLIRTRQPLSALTIGLGVGLAAFAGGPTLQALLAAWSAANALLHDLDADRRP